MGPPDPQKRPHGAGGPPAFELRPLDPAVRAASAAAAAPADAAAAAAKPRGKKKGGDPERRKQCSIHALMKRISLECKSAAAGGAAAAAAAGEPATSAAAAAAAREASDSANASGSSASPPSQSPAAAAAATAAAAAKVPAESPDEVSLFMFDFGECDAQRCSGRRLLRHCKLNKITAAGRVQYAQRLGGRSSSSRSSS
ncbi:hypothetical protein, conserved, partial [Eimeria necatrix]